jgi:hypothetical protein
MGEYFFATELNNELIEMICNWIGGQGFLPVQAWEFWYELRGWLYPNDSAISAHFENYFGI